MTPIVHRAIPADIDPLFCMGSEEPAFGVSPQIWFYEREELIEWIASPEDNILLVLDDDGRIKGFLFCKVMSSHWAYLDNFYVHPSCCGHGHGHLLMQALLDLLRERRVRTCPRWLLNRIRTCRSISGSAGLSPKKPTCGRTGSWSNEAPCKKRSERSPAKESINPFMNEYIRERSAWEQR